jgi:hypothetical protein
LFLCYVLDLFHFGVLDLSRFLEKEMKHFVAIITETIDNRLVKITTSAGESIGNENGIDFLTAVDFLFALRLKSIHRKNKTVFVSYGFTRDNEFIFSTMTKELKDKLFQSYDVKQKLNRIEFENEKLDEIYYQKLHNERLMDTQEFEQVDFERYVNFLAEKELIEVKAGGYDISLANGKRLTVRKNKKSISIYDIYGFFKNDSLFESCKKWQVPYNNEVEAIALLATALNKSLEYYGIKLSRYHGATAVTSWLLTKSKAKDYYHALRYKRQISTEFHKATYQSYYGGRAEQLKLGTLYNVNIYDINSAYAFACSFLPVLLSKPRFVKAFTDEFIFSQWLVTYNFADTDSYFGYFPNRNRVSTDYKLAGKTYLWYPELQFALQHFPECIEIHQGFVWDYTPAPFGQDILEMYELRRKLQKQGNPLEKVLKKALQSVYGKFCQHQGKGHFYNMSYAGFICSFVRRMLLDATFGNEKETICFLTDAIHTTANLNISVSDHLGEYKKESYEKVEYLDNGVYRCWNDGKIVKTKHKGSKHFDFSAALNLLNEKQYYKADNSIFVGHNIFAMNQFSKAKYLENFALDKEINPIENCPRIFENKIIDFSREFLDSKPNALYGGKESGIYRHNDFNVNDFSLDTIEARAL